MSWTRMGATAVMVVAMLMLAPMASARTLNAPDEAGDASGRGLDLVHVHATNRDRGVVTRVRVVRAVRGDLIVSVDPRRARGVRLVNRHRSQGTDRNSVMAGSFGDRPGGALACPGFRVSWDASLVTLRLPSRCLNQGDYGAIRISVLTEDPDGGDVDWAPERPRGDMGATNWTPRG